MQLSEKVHSPEQMHWLGGDQGLDHEDTESEQQLADGEPAPVGSSSSSAAPAVEVADEAAVAEERQKEDEFISTDPPVAVRAAQPAAARENEDTRTPSSCSDELQQASSNEDRGDCGEDAAAAEAAHRNDSGNKSEPKRGQEDSPESNGRVPHEEEGNESAQQIVEGDPTEGTPPAALIPHLSMPGLRGPRPAPALGRALSGQEKQVATAGCAAIPGQKKGSLGSLLTWLDDADVGDVLDQVPLSDLLQAPGHGHLATMMHASRALLPQAKRPSMHAVDRPSEERTVAEAREPALDAATLDDSDGDEDDFEEVPSDKEALPRAPPLAPSAAPLMRPLSPEFSPRELQPRMTGYCANPGANPSDGHNEEEEWFARQRLTGAIGRLVRYSEAEIAPKDDILGLRCTRRGRIMVTAVRENGIAAKAGVVAGDELVSIDGRKEFVGHPAHVVHASLRAPVTLVFLGFVGKLQAEVRVKRPPEPKCGLAPGTDVVVHTMDKQPPSMKLCDAVVFQQGDSPSLLITAGTSDCQEPPSPVPQEHAAAFSSEEPSAKTIMYELQREDARNLIVNALGTTATL